MVGELGKFSDEALLSEVAKRKNKGWCYIVGNPHAKSGDDLQFVIMHKRLWHLEHDLPDWDVAHLLNLPKKFAGEGCIFDYHGNPEDGDHLLTQVGLTRIDNPFWDANHVYCPVLKKGWPRMDFVSDTPEIYAKLEQQLKEWPARAKELPAEWKREIVMARIDKFAQANGLAAVVTSGDDPERVWQGAGISLLSKELAASLPPYPQKDAVDYLRRNL